MVLLSDAARELVHIDHLLCTACEPKRVVWPLNAVPERFDPRECHEHVPLVDNHHGLVEHTRVL